MCSPAASTPRATGGRGVRYAGASRPRQAFSQSSYLTLSGCQLLSQGGPGVRLARHRPRRQALRRQHGISGGGKHCDDNDAQPGASAAATSTACTTMHNPTAFHTDGVTATCSTLVVVHICDGKNDNYNYRSYHLKYGLRHRHLKSLPLCSNLVFCVFYFLPTFCSHFKVGRSFAECSAEYYIRESRMFRKKVRRMFRRILY